MGFNPRRGCSEKEKGACQGSRRVWREKPSSHHSRMFHGIRGQGQSGHWGHSRSKTTVKGHRGGPSWGKQWVQAAASSFLDSSENSDLHFSGQAKEEKEAGSCPADQADNLRRDSLALTQTGEGLQEAFQPADPLRGTCTCGRHGEADLENPDPSKKQVIHTRIF